MVFIASVPRLRWKNSLLYLGVEAECNQWFRPSQRSPVSSKLTTKEALMRALTWARNSVRSAAARAVTAATVPSDTGTPNSSPMAWAVRFLDRNCPMNR